MVIRPNLWAGATVRVHGAEADPWQGVRTARVVLPMAVRRLCPSPATRRMFAARGLHWGPAL